MPVALHSPQPNPLSSSSPSLQLPILRSSERTAILHMASSSAPLLLHPLPIRRRSQSEHPLLPTRRLVLSSPAIFLVLSSPARAEDIPLFGLRKKLKKIEEEAEEVVREGEKVVEEGIAAAEKEVAAAEEGISAAAAGVGVFGDLGQAGAVAGAEVLGVLVGLSVVNGILGPEGRRRT